MVSTLSPDQLRIRQRGIGGSDMNALSGFSSRWRPIDVWRSKVEPINDTEHSNVDQARGIFLEPAMRNWYSHHTGAIVEEVGTLFSPRHERVLATPDGKVHSPDGETRALEIKCPRFSMTRDWCINGDIRGGLTIPRYYWPQLEWEAEVLACQEVHMWVLLGDEPHLLTYRRNEAFFESLLYLAEKFWHDHVLPCIPPSPDASDSYAEYLQARHPEHVPAPLIDMSEDPKVVALAREHHAALQMLKEAEQRKQKSANALKALIKDAPGLEFGPYGKVTWKSCKASERIDYGRLIESLNVEAEVIRQFTVQTPGTRRFNAYLKGFEL